MFPKETQTAPTSPLEAWQSAFNYAFGFQIKLLYGFFGLNPDAGKDA